MNRVKEMAVDVSIIVPVRNAEAFLVDCLQSLVGQQTEYSFEIICIDDGSTDGSRDILRDYSSRFEHVTFDGFAESRGVSVARNRGLDLARGRYILFCDSDDTVDDSLIQKVVTKADVLGADMTIFGFSEWHASIGAMVPREMCEERELEVRCLRLEDLPCIATSLTTPNVWRILFRRLFIEDSALRFHNDLKTSEDLAFIYEALLMCQRICTLNERLYNYRRDGGVSLTRGDRGDAGYRALRYIRMFAEDRSMMDRSAMRHYVNLVLDVAQYAMWSSSACEEYQSLFEGFRTDWMPLISQHEGMIDERYREFWNSMRQMDAQEYLFGLFSRDRQTVECWSADRIASGKRIDELNAEKMAALEDSDALRQRLSAVEDALAGEKASALAAQGELERVYASRSYRLGSFLLKIPRALKKRIQDGK